VRIPEMAPMGRRTSSMRPIQQAAFCSFFIVLPSLPADDTRELQHAKPQHAEHEQKISAQSV
jgi:hypothetical protein